MSKCWYCNNELTSENNPKHFGICNKCYDTMFKSGDIIIHSLTNKLKQQLAEKDKEITMLKSQNQFFMEETKRLDQISNLKDQEIEELKANQTPTDKELKPQEYDNYNLADKLRYRDSQVKEALIRMSDMNEMEDVLRSQLAEKDKEIERLNNLLADADDELEEIEKVYTEKCKWLDKKYQELIEEDIKDQRHQICEKIREKIYQLGSDAIEISEYMNVMIILDQIEKGE